MHFLQLKKFLLNNRRQRGNRGSIRYFGEGIYFDKSISLNKNQKLKKLKNKNIKVVCQDEEGGFNKIFKKHISTFLIKEFHQKT